MKYQRSTILCCKDIGIRKFEFVTKTQFLCAPKINQSTFWIVLDGIIFTPGFFPYAKRNLQRFHCCYFCSFGNDSWYCIIVIVLIQNQFTPTRSRKHGYFLQVFLCHTHTKVFGHPYTHPSLRTHIHTPRYTDTLTHT